MTVEFIDRGNSTELILTHVRLPNEDQRLKHAEGWKGCLDYLEIFVAKHPRRETNEINNSNCLIMIFVLNSFHLFADSGLDKIKSLVGEWETTTADGKSGTVKYELISNGTAVEERLGMHEEEMVTIYHMNGDKLMMTHYCAFNNQPRLKDQLQET